MEPAILLMDEPFAALDALTRRKMQDELLRLWEETRFTVLFVTHSIDEAVRVASRILLLSPHPGQVKAELGSTGRDDVHPLTGARLSDSHPSASVRASRPERRKPPMSGASVVALAFHSVSVSCPAKAGHPVTPVPSVELMPCPNRSPVVTGSPGQAGR